MRLETAMAFILGCLVGANTAHLEAVTNAENQLRSPLTIPGAAVRRSECPNGHELDGIKVGPRRYCKTCHRERARIARAEKRAA